MFDPAPRGGVKTYSKLGDMGWCIIDCAIPVVMFRIFIDYCFVYIKYNISFSGKHGISTISKYWYSIPNAFNCKFTL